MILKSGSVSEGPCPGHRKIRPTRDHHGYHCLSLQNEGRTAGEKVKTCNISNAMTGPDGWNDIMGAGDQAKPSTRPRRGEDLHSADYCHHENFEQCSTSEAKLHSIKVRDSFETSDTHTDTRQSDVKHVCRFCELGQTSGEDSRVTATSCTYQSTESPASITPLIYKTQDHKNEPACLNVLKRLRTLHEDVQTDVSQGSQPPRLASSLPPSSRADWLASRVGRQVLATRETCDTRETSFARVTRVAGETHVATMTRALPTFLLVLVFLHTFCMVPVAGSSEILWNAADKAEGCTMNQLQVATQTNAKCNPIINEVGSSILRSDLLDYTATCRHFQQYATCMEPTFPCKGMVKDFRANYNVYTASPYNCTLSNGTVLPSVVDGGEESKEQQQGLAGGEANAAGNNAGCYMFHLASLVIVWVIQQVSTQGI